MKIGIVGNGTDKFTTLGKKRACELIQFLFDVQSDHHITLVSGHSPVGGIDIWAETIADWNNLHKDIKTPKQHSWSGSYGYKARNLDIAKSSDVLHVIVADVYPKEYTGQKFKTCYHCYIGGNNPPHVKSGGCWTGIKARYMFKKPVQWHIIPNY
jgi:hypothetical protein